MIHDLLSLRALVASADEGLRRLFQQAAAGLSVPFEVVEAAAAGAPSSGIDLAYLDGGLPPEELRRLVAAIRAGAKPAFTLQLAPGAVIQSFETDGLVGKPTRPEEAQWLLERTAKLRLPNRVLVVDDSSTMRTIVRKTLAATRFMFDVSEAEAGLAALDLLRAGDYEIVFLDYNMPGLDGLETLSEFNRQGYRVKVIMMTSVGREELAARARALGAIFLKKPFFPADVESALLGFYGLRALNPKRG